MFWFKANNAYELHKESWSKRYIKDYNIYDLKNRQFNSSLVYAIYKINGYWFIYNEEEFATEKYKKKEEELNKLTLYIVEIGNYVLDVSKETYDKILSENQGKIININ